MTDVWPQLKRLREYRGRREVDWGIAGAVASTASALHRRDRQLGEIIESWRQIIPDELLQGTEISCLRAGALLVIADSASLKYELERILRSGAAGELCRRHAGQLHRVRVQLR